MMRLSALGKTSFAILVVAAVWTLVGGVLLLVQAGTPPRCEGCSFLDAVGAMRRSRWDGSGASAIRKQMRLVGSDAGMEHWTTPLGEFWLKAGPGAAEDFALQIAEIQSKPHGAIRPGGIVLDCGAQFGSFTRSALRAGAGKVVAIEPSPECLPCLRRTFAAEIADNRVVVIAKGVWDREGEMVLNLPDVGYGGASLVFEFADGGRGKAKVPLTTVDRIVGELELPRLDFIKMDIEGAERRAIMGSAETLRRFGPALAISGYHLADDSAVIPQAVMSLNPQYVQSRSDCVYVLGRVAPQTLFFDRAATGTP